ncbi:MAG: hypothetical protein NC095_11065 [Muribaculum sp.]|nr:hypothetical protein [Muribaculum sp.]
MILADGIEIGEQGHLAPHGLAGRELAVYPEIALVEERFVRGPTLFPFGIAVGNYAYCRKDGVWIVPIGCLKN